MALTRRGFLKSLGIVVGGVAVGNIGVINREAPLKGLISAQRYTKIKPDVFGDSCIPEKWAEAGLKILEENMVISNLVHRDFASVVYECGDTVTPGVPYHIT